MEQDGEQTALEGVDALIGAWSMVPDFEAAGAGARVTFEWLPGRRFAI